jgi:prepilin-type N-terminal cleavage/methylation domain-containing protein
LQEECGDIAFLPSLRANAKQSSTSLVILAQRVSIAKQCPKIKLSFTNPGQPASGLDSQLSAENDNLKKHRNDSLKNIRNNDKGRFPPNYSEGMTVGYGNDKLKSIDPATSTGTLATREAMTSKAFTLIELLVVVLIIGILAAIALPYYQEAAARSKMTEAITIGKAIRDAEELYYLANGKYTTSLDDLDITVSDKNFRITLDTYYFRVYLNPRNSIYYDSLSFCFGNNFSSICDKSLGRIICSARTDNPKQIKFCKSLNPAGNSLQFSSFTINSID